MTEVAGAWPICGDCDVCLRRTNALLRGPDAGVITLDGAPVPTAAALEKHAERFGSLMVPETAAEYGLTVAVEKYTPPRRRSRRRRP